MLYCADCLEILQNFPKESFDSVVTDPPAGISFQSKGWDSNKGGRNTWISWLTEIMVKTYICLKPGAHIFVWSLPKTSHWTATAIEDAGFEIRDVITHHFSNSFPKNQDISKAIDKKFGAERQVIGVKPGHEDFANRKTKGHLAFNGATEGFDRPWMYNDQKRALYHMQTAPTTEEAKYWDGWGTALKPASENWILARKPLSEKTIADNVLKYGTGAINIKDARVSDKYPSNVIMSHAEECDEICVGGCPIGEMGAPSKFFYHAKPTKKERNIGLPEGMENNHPTVKGLDLCKYLVSMITLPNGKVLDMFGGTFSVGVAAISLGFQFVGIEKELDYFKIGEARIKHAESLCS